MKVLIVLLVCLCVACKKKADSSEGVRVIEGYDNEVLTNGAGLSIKSFKIVPLELTEASLLSDISRVEVVGSSIVVLDNERLLCFDESGKYKWSYGEKGRGPGEYIRINTFCIGPEQKTVMIVDEYLNKIITYALDGSFIGERKYASGSLSMVHSGVLLDKENLLLESYIFNKRNTLYSVLNLKTEENREIYRLPVATQNVAMPIGRRPVAVFEDSSRLILPFDNKIYTLRDTGLIPVMTVQTARELLPRKILEAEDNFSMETYMKAIEQGYFLGFKDICETKDYLFLNEAGGSRYFLIDKRKNTGRLYTYHPGETLDRLPVLGIITADSTRLIGYYPNFSLKALANLIPEDTRDNRLGQFRSFVSTMEDDANPCLLFYEFE